MNPAIPFHSTLPRALAIAAWPAIAGGAYAVYAIAPEYFPAGTDYLLAVFMFAEFALLFSSFSYAMALDEDKRRARHLLYAMGLITPLPLFLMFEREHVMPLAVWILISQLLAFWSLSPNPDLARAHARAILNDKLALLGLIPVLLVTVLVIFGLMVWAGTHFGWNPERWIRDHGQPSWFALLGSFYLLMVAWITIHAHGPTFARQRRRLLDRPWLRAISNFLHRGSTLRNDDL